MVFQSGGGHPLTTAGQDEHARAHGTVQGCHDHTTDGVIRLEDEPDVFVHWSALIESSLRLRHEGDQVTPQLSHGPSGPQAQIVNKVTTMA